MVTPNYRHIIFMIAFSVMLAYPSLDPVALDLGLFQIRWYGLAYLAGIGLGVAFLWRQWRGWGLTPSTIWDGVAAIVMGILLGGRLGYCLIYATSYYAQHPWEIGFVWNGGMSFHGGLMGVLVAVWWVSKQWKCSMWKLLDSLARVTPIGLFFGRIANFVNAELMGRVTNVPWGMPMPQGGPLPRHPSTLYEAMGEGLVLWLLLWALSRMTWKDGQLGAWFLLGYGSIRFGIEFTREPDAQLGLLWGLSMGQWWCLGMVIVGGVLLRWRGQSNR